MKLKYITLVSFFVFVGSIVALAFLPVGSIKNDSLNTNLSNAINTQNTIGVVDANLAGVGGTKPPINLTLTEIAKHNTRNDCYITIKGAVYSVSSFINQHPGGVKKITDMCGGEATAVFSAIHSNFAWNLLKDFYIGNVGQSIDPNKVESLNVGNQNNTNNNSLKNNKGSNEYENEDEED